MQIGERPDDGSSAVYHQHEREGSVRGRKQVVQGTRRSIKIWESVAFRKCGMLVQVQGKVEWRPRRTRFLDCLVDHSNRANGQMAHGAGKEKKRTHELGHVLARIAAASSLAFPVPSAARWGALRVAMSSASSPTSLRRSRRANLRLTFARSTAST